MYYSDRRAPFGRGLFGCFLHLAVEFSRGNVDVITRNWAESILSVLVVSTEREDYCLIVLLLFL